MLPPHGQSEETVPSRTDWLTKAIHEMSGELHTRITEDLVVALHEHDIEALWKAKKLADALGAPQPHFG